MAAIVPRNAVGRIRNADFFTAARVFSGGPVCRSARDAMVESNRHHGMERRLQRHGSGHATSLVSIERAWQREGVMSCTHHLLNFRWGHHKWERRVIGTEDLHTAEVNMWGRPVTGHAVRCDTEYVCRQCGATKRHESCICDRTAGEQCQPRLAYLNRAAGADGR